MDQHRYDKREGFQSRSSKGSDHGKVTGDTRPLDKPWDMLSVQYWGEIADKLAPGR